jgi:large subunit ribosomal protein L10
LAISREKKEQIVSESVDQLADSRAVLFTDYRGLSVAQMNQLRSNLREKDGRYQVIKNTLLRLALQGADLPIPEEFLTGPVAITYCFGEVPAVAKALYDFADETKILTVKGALLGNQVLDAKAVKDVADLPPREILLAQLLGVVQGPMANLASVLAAPLRDLVSVLQARSEQSAEAAA